MSHLRDIQDWLQDTDLTGLIVPSADEFLSEFSPPANRRLRWATGFRGSTGVAVIFRDSAALFLDGRYLLQGASDTAGSAISIEPTALPSRRDFLRGALERGARLGIDPWLHSLPDVEQWRGLGAELGCEIVMLAENPIDRLWLNGRPEEHRPRIFDYPAEYAGEHHEAKCTALADYIRNAGLDALLVADPEDVSWLLNVRAAGNAFKVEAGEWHIVPSCVSRALVHRDGGVTWYVESAQLDAGVAARGEEVVTIAPPRQLAIDLRDAARKKSIGADPHRTPAALAAIIGETGQFRIDDIVARRRWHKHVVEIDAARRAHIVDAAAVIRFMAWLTNAIPERSISEIDAAEKLESLRAEHPSYKGASMPLMSASGQSAAEPHYLPRRGACRNVNDHPIYVMDSGGQYLGGSTDNTITLALGFPEAKHVLAHTLVLKSHIALAMARFPVGTLALHLDAITRLPLWREGMDYPHGTGHGVGNYLNIHEGPVIRRELAPISTIPIEAGMIITNEPGYYVAGDFGLRLESHMAAVASRHPNFLEFDTISRLPIDPNLVDFGRLLPTERQWLADYHCAVLNDVEPLLDAPSANWLRTVVQAFVTQSGSNRG